MVGVPIARRLSSGGLFLLLAATAVAQAGTAVTATLKGKVTAAGDAKVRVTVWHNDMQRIRSEPVAEGFCSADGAFEFTDVPWFAGYDWGFHAMLVVAKAGDRTGLLALRGDTRPLDTLAVELRPAIDLRGRLVDENDGKPVVGAWVWPAMFGEGEHGMPAVWLTAPVLPWHTQTDAEGRFVLKGVPDLRPIKLLASGEHHARRWIAVDDPTEPVDDVLAPGGRIAGRVLMPDGEPAGRVRVESTSNGAGYGHTHTDDDGRFVLTGLEAGTYKVWAEVDDLTVIAVTDIEVEAGDVVENQTVQLVRGGFIVGRIVDAETGAPFVPGPQTDVAMYGPARGSGGSCECTPVLPDGTFRIRAPAGRNRIYLRAAGGSAEPSEYVEVVEGEETQVEWKLKKGQVLRRRINLPLR